MDFTSNVEAISVQTRQHKYLISIITLTLMIPSLGFCAQRDKVAAYVRQYANQAQRDAERSQTLIDQQRNDLLEQISFLEESLREEKAKLEESETRFNGLLQKEQSVQHQLQQGEHDTQRIMDVYLTIQKDVQAMLSSSLVHAQTPLLFVRTEDQDGPGNAANLADVKQLVEALFAEMLSSGKIQRYRGAFIGSQGTEVQGEILRLGNFNAFYRMPGGVGFLKIDKTSGKLMGIPVASSWFVRNDEQINDYFDGKTDILPMDLSRGEIVTQYGTGRDLFEWLRSGGVLVWPILFVGLVAFLLIIERLIFLLRTKANSEKLMAEIQRLAIHEHWQECQEHCSDHGRASVFRVLQAGLRNLGSNREILENALQEAIMKELPRLERFLSTISVLAAIAPLLGLLGTVSGMINTFNAITIHGTGDPRMLSGGISEALVTTQLGLMVAVPVLVLHHFLERRVDTIIAEMEEKSTALKVIMLKNRGIHGGMVSQAA